jgi:CPA2 family monovalent cation:H+ antiporter-2
MPHETTLIATIVAGLVLAFIGGIIASKLRLPPLVGYLLAGVAVGPFTPGFVADETLAAQLAEIGVILLMFGVGLHFSIKDLLAVRGIAIPGAIGQIVFATALGAGVALLWGCRSALALCSAWRSRWRAPWCCCVRLKSATASIPTTAGSRWAG